jgi:hypothetical protein
VHHKEKTAKSGETKPCLREVKTRTNEPEVDAKKHRPFFRYSVEIVIKPDKLGLAW